MSLFNNEEFIERDPDYYINNINLVKLLTQNNLLQVISNEALFRICENDENAYFEIFKKDNNFFFNSAELTQLSKKHKSIFKQIVRTNNLDQIELNSIVENVNLSIADNRKNIQELKAIVEKSNFAYDESNQFYRKEEKISLNLRGNLISIKITNKRGCYIAYLLY